jgi:hypothetical protein
MIKLSKDDRTGWWIVVGEKDNWPSSQRLAVTAEEVMDLSEQIVEHVQELEKESHWFKKRGMGLSIG